MNCSTFKKRLFDYMEDNMVYDMKKAMENHIESCEGCKVLYEEEKNIDNMLRGAFKLEDYQFTSSRSTIIRNIDKNKYSNSIKNKIFYHMQKYRIKYLSSVAVLILAMISVPYVLKPNVNVKMENNSISDMMSVADNGKSAKSSKGVMEKGNDNNLVNSMSSSSAPQVDTTSESMGQMEKKSAGSYDVATKNNFSPQFEKKEIDINSKLYLQAKPKTSPNGNLKVYVEGRGEELIEEGVAKIIIEDTSLNKKFTLELIQSDMQHTPKCVDWSDNENLLVIVGGAYGAVNLTGDVYNLNIDTCEVSLVYSSSNRERVVCVTKQENNLKLLMRIYTDDEINNYYEEERIIVINK